MNEVKRQAVIALQKAITAAEAKAAEILAVDRTKMEITLEEVMKQTREEMTSLLGRQEEAKEVPISNYLHIFVFPLINKQCDVRFLFQCINRKNWLGIRITREECM